MSASLPDPIILIAKQAGNIRIHTFVASFTYDNLANATHIIESAKALVVVDAQFLVPYSRQFRSYADSLNKPIDRVYLSHRHPDHWFGLATAFSDLDVYALQETIDYLKTQGEATRKDHLPKLGALAPESVLIPQNAVATPGEDTIDGVKYRFDKVVDTEIDFLLRISLPDLGVYIVQDLVYSGTHLYLTKDLGHWIQVLQGMLTSDYELFMPGHGLPADKNEVARNIEYLSAAKEAIDGGLIKGAFREFMIKRYPARLCPGIFDIYLPRLFGTEGQF